MWKSHLRCTASILATAVLGLFLEVCPRWVCGQTRNINGNFISTLSWKHIFYELTRWPSELLMMLGKTAVKHALSKEHLASWEMKGGRRTVNWNSMVKISRLKTFSSWLFLPSSKAVPRATSFSLAIHLLDFMHSIASWIRSLWCTREKFWSGLSFW